MRRASFTLTEVLVAVTILVAGFLPVYLFFFSSESISAETARSFAAMNVAQSLTDALAECAFDDLPPSPRVPFPVYRAGQGNSAAFFPTDGWSAAGFSVDIAVTDHPGDRHLQVWVIDQNNGGERGGSRLEPVVTRP